MKNQYIHIYIYRYTTQVFLDQKMKDKGAIDNYLPVQLLFCLKEKNKKKVMIILHIKRLIFIIKILNLLIYIYL